MIIPEFKVLIQEKLRNAFLRQKPINWLIPADLELIPPRNYWLTPTDSFSHFIRWSWEYLAYLTLLCQLKRDSKILELGCHHGRTAIGLVKYLRPPGKYEGLDIQKQQIEWAKKHFPNNCFNFNHADIFNGMYNPTGKFSASVFNFPYAKNYFDTVYAASLFTHLLPDATAKYIKEIYRVLKPDGKALLSFCLLDYYRGSSFSINPKLYAADFKFIQHNGVAIRDPKTPEALVMYSKKLINKYIRSAGLTIKKVIPGYWSKLNNWAVNEQDLILIEKSVAH